MNDKQTLNQMYTPVRATLLGITKMGHIIILHHMCPSTTQKAETSMKSNTG